MPYKICKVPAGEKITISAGKLQMPDRPIVPFIEGDGTGPDIWRAWSASWMLPSRKRMAAKSKSHWMEVYAGEKAFTNSTPGSPMKPSTPSASSLVGIKGPLTTPIGGGIRSLNVALRQMLDLYVCLRPVRWFKGVPSPVKNPDKIDMVIFRENTEDIYAGIEFEAGSEAARNSSTLVQGSLSERIRQNPLPRNQRHRHQAGLQGRHRTADPQSPEYAIANKRKSLTLVHKGNIMKYTEGAFRNWGYALAKREFAQVYTWDQWELTKKARARPPSRAKPPGRAKSSSRTPLPTSPCSKC